MISVIDLFSSSSILLFTSCFLYHLYCSSIYFSGIWLRTAIFNAFDIGYRNVAVIVDSEKRWQKWLFALR